MIPEPFENRVFDAFVHAISQYNIWSEEIEKYYTCRDERDDAEPFAGQILQNKSGEIRYHCYISPFNIDELIVGYVNCVYRNDNDFAGLMFMYALSEELDQEINSDMIREYLNDLVNREATSYDWFVLKMKMY
jgi:hypothetical protein